MNSMKHKEQASTTQNNLFLFLTKRVIVSHYHHVLTQHQNVCQHVKSISTHNAYLAKLNSLNQKLVA